jgi:hypothetical protein
MHTDFPSVPDGREIESRLRAIGLIGEAFVGPGDELRIGEAR